MLRTSRILAIGAFLLGILLGASVCGASSSSEPPAADSSVPGPEGHG